MRSLIWLWTCVGGVSASLTVAEAQQPFVWHAVDGATATAVGVLWSHGYDDDDRQQCGLARVLASCRLERGREAAPGLLLSGMSVGWDYALVFGVVGARDADAGARFLAALLDDELPLGDDRLAILIARAALVADDAEFLYPGSVLSTAARRDVCEGMSAARPPDGLATAIQRLTPGEVRRRLRDAVALRGAGVGAVSPGFLAAIDRLPWPSAPCAPRGVSTAPSWRGTSKLHTARHSRVDSPFVAVAFPRTGDGDQVGHALAIEVAKARAFARFASRGTEALARAPFVDWSWRTCEPLVVFCRRGEDFIPLLPGQRREADATAEAEVTARELRALLEDLRSRPVTDAEVEQARRLLLAELRLPTPGVVEPWAADPASLPGRLAALLLASHHAIDRGEIASAIVDDVRRAMAGLLVGSGNWHALLPEPHDERGFRRR